MAKVMKMTTFLNTSLIFTRMHWWVWSGNSIVAPDQGFCQREISQRIKEGFNQIYIMWRNFLVDKYERKDKDKYKNNRDKYKKGWIQSNLHNVEEFSGATAQNFSSSSRLLCSVTDSWFLFHCW